MIKYSSNNYSMYNYIVNINYKNINIKIIIFIAKSYVQL